MSARTGPGHAVQAEGTDRRRFLARTVLGTAGTVASWLISRSYGWALAPAAEEPAPPPPTISPQQRRSHEDYMRQAIAQAKQVPRLPFGVVIVRRATGEIVAEGFNRSSDNPTLHGEIDAINRCAAAHQSIDWTGLDLYTTAEPCPMCQSAIEWAGIATVYYGTSIPYLKDRGWWQIDIRAEEVARRTPFRQTKIVGGILESECNPLFDAAPKGTFKT
ncbi:MAG: nucleoside deaminase [candidate division NC10 bacterium]|nr:nucleoside deaminase [candidate division NC10 bacterium]